MSLKEVLSTGGATTASALEIFDSLDPVDIDFMIGQWSGEGFNTGHQMDGLLEAYNWYGKRFESQEDVHPLIFSVLGKGLASVNPVFMGKAMRMKIPKSGILPLISRIVMPLLTTSYSKARLRMTSYRGKLSATMCYDQLPIHDVFRRIDKDTVFGVMDLKGMEIPFFFILHRES